MTPELEALRTRALVALNCVEVWISGAAVLVGTCAIIGVDKAAPAYLPHSFIGDAVRYTLDAIATWVAPSAIVTGVAGVAVGKLPGLPKTVQSEPVG